MTEHAVHLSQVQLARRWHISQRTLERWRWLDRGPAFVKLDGRIIYRLADVEAYEAARRHDPAQEQSR